MPPKEIVIPQGLAAMTDLTSFDSVTAAAMPSTGAQIRFGYLDGDYANLAQVKADFPSSVDLGITVWPSVAANMLDCEAGNCLPADCPAWWRTARAAGIDLPIIYCPASWATLVVAAMTADGISRDQWLIITAHYGHGQHICGPDVCGIPITADGTQWIDWGLAGGANFDQSLLGPRFDVFLPAVKTTTPPKTTTIPTEDDVQAPISAIINDGATKVTFWLVAGRICYKLFSTTTGEVQGERDGYWVGEPDAYPALASLDLRIEKGETAGKPTSYFDLDGVTAKGELVHFWQRVDTSEPWRISA